MDKIKEILTNMCDFFYDNKLLFKGGWHIFCIFMFIAYLMYAGVLSLIPACWLFAAILSGEDFIISILEEKN